MKHIINNNDQPYAEGEGIVTYRVWYLKKDDNEEFIRLRANSVLDLYNKVCKLPGFQRVIKYD